MQMRKKASEYIKNNEEMEAVKIAKEYGHEVVWTQPYYSDLQPIEFVWAWMKRAIGRQYDNDTTLKDVYGREFFSKVIML